MSELAASTLNVKANAGPAIKQLIKNDKNNTFFMTSSSRFEATQTPPDVTPLKIKKAKLPSLLATRLSLESVACTPERSVAFRP
jgi:hypothetical protein